MGKRPFAGSVLFPLLKLHPFFPNLLPVFIFLQSKKINTLCFFVSNVGCIIDGEILRILGGFEKYWEDLGFFSRTGVRRYCVLSEDFVWQLERYLPNSPKFSQTFPMLPNVSQSFPMLSGKHRGVRPANGSPPRLFTFWFRFWGRRYLSSRRLKDSNLKPI